jgi:hypothetical protein
MTLKSFNDANSLEARQHLLDRRNERKHPKRHRTLGRRKKLNAAKREKHKANRIAAAKDRSVFLANARLYWNGDADGHP